jgi:hypothetical protein
VADRFCAHCGQRHVERLVSFRSLVHDVLADQLSLEARLPRTLGALLGHPGKLTSEYAAGRVARYIPPFRLYIFCGLVFFFVVSFVASFDRVWGSVTGRVEDLTGQSAADAMIVLVNLPVDTLRVPRPLLPLARRYVQQEARLNALPPREAMRIVYGGLIGNVSLTLALLVPAFALLLKALYRRRLYIEHVVFILHLHAAFFVLALLPMLVPSRWTAGAMGLAAVAYGFLALRRVYRQSVLRTVAKYAVMLLMYNVAIVMVLLAIVTATVLRF